MAVITGALLAMKAQKAKESAKEVGVWASKKVKLNRKKMILIAIILIGCAIAALMDKLSKKK